MSFAGHFTYGILLRGIPNKWLTYGNFRSSNLQRTVIEYDIKCAKHEANTLTIQNKTENLARKSINTNNGGIKVGVLKH